MRTVVHGISERLYSWKTTAISSGGAVTRSPCRTTSPRVGRRRPAMHLSSVVLPQPDGPTTHTSSRSAIENEMLRSAWVTWLPEPYVFATSLISSIRSPYCGVAARHPRCQASIRRSASR